MRIGFVLSLKKFKSLKNLGVKNDHRITIHQEK